MFSVWVSVHNLNIWASEEIRETSPVCSQECSQDLLLGWAWELRRVSSDKHWHWPHHTSHLSRWDEIKTLGSTFNILVLFWFCPRHANWCRKQKRILKTILINVSPGPRVIMIVCWLAICVRDTKTEKITPDQKLVNKIHHGPVWWLLLSLALTAAHLCSLPGSRPS